MMQCDGVMVADSDRAQEAQPNEEPPNQQGRPEAVIGESDPEEEMEDAGTNPIVDDV